MSAVLELFGLQVASDWQEVIDKQHCPYLGRKCLKNRKSTPEIAIGTCSVTYGSFSTGVIICPHRLLERQQIFLDCLHLLTAHEPGNQLHVVPEVSLPGGMVDYVLVSAQSGLVKDFVGIELQTLDTTGSVWSERQSFLRKRGIKVASEADKIFGMNWKMTAKTILVQMHHKVSTFEILNKHLVLVIQNPLEDYMRREFSFSHIENAKLDDSFQLHSYDFNLANSPSLKLHSRTSTNAIGIAQALGLQTEARVELEALHLQLERKLSSQNILRLA